MDIPAPHPQEWVNRIAQNDMVLWRYLDLYKFISMVKDGTLFFPRATTLSNSMDRLEGSFTPSAVALRTAQVVHMGRTLGVSEEGLEKIETSIKNDDKVQRFLESYITCWHAHPAESEAMWQLYTYFGKGVAIRTTLSKLNNAVCSALNNSPTYRNFHYYVAPMHYINHSSDSFDQKLSLEAPLVKQFFHKNESFRHEQELRLLLLNLGNEGDHPFVSLPIDWGTVIDAIVLPPRCEPWIRDCITYVAGSLSSLIRPSSLDQEPLF